MIVAVADTHALHWYLENHPRLSETARNFIEATAATDHDQIAISAELYARLLTLLSQTENGLFREIPVDARIAQALVHVKRNDVPDMPDRIIAATALHLDVPVISRDSKIKLSDIQTIW